MNNIKANVLNHHTDDNIYSINHKTEMISDLDCEMEVISKIAEIEKCENQEELMEIVKNDDFDIRVRLYAADKITDEVFLNYILVSINLRSSFDNFKITLKIAEKAKDQDIVNHAMWDVLSNFHFFQFYPCSNEIFKTAISYTTSIEVLEKFISHVEKHGNDQRFVEIAYNRAMELLEKE